MAAGKLISVVMPAYNEEGNLPRAFQLLNEIFRSKLPEYDYEVIVIDNDSVDGTEAVATSFCQEDAHWKYLRFSRNFSSEISLAAGLRYAKGDAVIILFSDLQDPPELIPEFVKQWENGYAVVCGQLKKREDDVWWKGAGAHIAYYLLNRLTDIHLPQNMTDYRLLSRPVVEAINRLDERNRYFRGLAHWVGFKTTSIEYSRNARLNGKSNTSFWYLIDFTVRALTNFSITPLRVFSGFGLCILAFTVFYSVLTAFLWALGHAIAGLTTVYILLLAILGVLALGIGTLGEYIGRIYIETKRRPLWVVARTSNLEISSEDRYG